MTALNPDDIDTIKGALLREIERAATYYVARDPDDAANRILIQRAQDAAKLLAKLES